MKPIGRTAAAAGASPAYSPVWIGQVTPPDVDYQPGQSDFSQLAASSLGDAGTGADGFDSLLSDVLGLLPALDTQGDAIDSAIVFLNDLNEVLGATEVLDSPAVNAGISLIGPLIDGLIAGIGTGPAIGGAPTGWSLGGLSALPSVVDDLGLLSLVAATITGDISAVETTIDGVIANLANSIGNVVGELNMLSDEVTQIISELQGGY